MSSVANGYVHRDKICASRPPLQISGADLKWYDIGYPDALVPENIHAVARGFLERVSPDLGGGDLGFVILHRCGDGQFYFLLAQTWLGNNEIWKTTFAKDRNDADFRLFPLEEPHKGTFCVWEAGAMWHEVGAWKRYLTSSRDDAARKDYLRDCYEGVV